MLQLQAIALGEGHQSADLILHVVFDLVGGQDHLPAAKAHQIGIAGVSAHGHAPLLGHADHLIHDHGVAGVVAAGYVGGGDVLDDALVVSDAVSAEAFAHVAVQIDGIHETHLFLLLGDHLDGGLIDFSVDGNAVTAHRTRQGSRGVNGRLVSLDRRLSLGRRSIQILIQSIEPLLPATAGGPGGR